MNENILFISVIGVFALILIIPLIIKIRDLKLLQTVTSLKRGTKSERKLVLKLLKRGIHSQAIFHDLYIEKRKGDFAQIDIVVATKEGIIVFEVKDFKGWIFGNGNHTHWTQVLAYGKKKFRFYNPIKQNNNHINHLRKQLTQFRSIPFFSIIVFYGKCDLKEINYVPEGTFIVKPHRLFEVLKHIKTNNDEAPYKNKMEIIVLLKRAVNNAQNEKIKEKHIENIKNLIGKHRIFD